MNIFLFLVYGGGFTFDSHNFSCQNLKFMSIVRRKTFVVDQIKKYVNSRVDTLKLIQNPQPGCILTQIPLICFKYSNLMWSALSRNLVRCVVFSAIFSQCLFSDVHPKLFVQICHTVFSPTCFVVEFV